MYKSIKYFAIAGSVVISSVLMGTVISVAVTVPIQGYENLATQRCLDSNPNGNVYTSANRCTSSSTNNYQKWQIITVGSRRRLKNRATSRCLDSNANGTVYTNPCGSTNNFQKWVERSYWLFSHERQAFLKFANNIKAATAQSLFNLAKNNLCLARPVYFPILTLLLT